jgi:hypothetical protein
VGLALEKFLRQIKKRIPLFFLGKQLHDIHSWDENLGKASVTRWIFTVWGNMIPMRA